MITQLLKDAYQQAIKDCISALQYDIESVVKIGIDGCNDIFHDSKTQKFISDQIMKELNKRIRSKTLKINF